MHLIIVFQVELDSTYTNDIFDHRGVLLYLELVPLSQVRKEWHLNEYFQQCLCGSFPQGFSSAVSSFIKLGLINTEPCPMLEHTADPVSWVHLNLLIYIETIIENASILH